MVYVSIIGHLKNCDGWKSGESLVERFFASDSWNILKNKKTNLQLLQIGFFVSGKSGC